MPYEILLGLAFFQEASRRWPVSCKARALSSRKVIRGDSREKQDQGDGVTICICIILPCLWTRSGTSADGQVFWPEG